MMDQKISMFNTKLNSILLICLLLFITLGIFGERIPVNNGLGWDGAIFSVILSNLETTGTLDTDLYRTQRILPLILIWAISKILHLGLDNQTIVPSFVVLNSLLILISFYFWHKITKFHNFNEKTRVLSFLAIFINYAILKMAFYNPVLTDTMAFTLGLASYYYYIKQNNFKLIIAIFLGTFSFPTLLYVGAIFLLWPYKIAFPHTPKTIRINLYLNYLILFLYAVIILFLLFIKPSLLNTPALSGAKLINYRLLPLSIILSLTYLYIVSNTFKNLDLYRYFINSFNLKRIGMVIILLVAFKVLIRVLSNNIDSFGIKSFGLNLIIQSLSNPLSFIVSHVIYFGPFLLLTLFFFKSFIKTVKSEGIGTFVFTLFYLYLFIGNESRQFINAFPVLLILTNLTLKNREFSWKFIFSLGFISLLFSRFWFMINKQRFEGDYLEFPWQNYFMSQGPWMSNKMYLFFLFIILATCTILYFAFKKEITLLIDLPPQKQTAIQ